jgi:hypothetical protein
LVVAGSDPAELVALARARGWTVAGTLETSRSGAARGFRRVRELLQQGSRGALVVDTVLLPRLATMTVVRELAELTQLGVEVASAREPWLSTLGEQGRLLSWLVCRLEEERDRARTPRSRASSEGRRPGRPRAVVPRETVIALREEGASLRHIGRAVGLGTATIQRFLAADADAEKAGGR